MAFTKNPRMKPCAVCGKLMRAYRNGAERDFCGRKCRNKAREKPRIMVPCGWCEEVCIEIVPGRKAQHYTCSGACGSKLRHFLQEEPLQHTEETRKVMSESRKAFNKTPAGLRAAKLSSERMLRKNPSKDPLVVEKIKETKRLNGTLNVWPGKRGGNGQLTTPQKLLAAILGSSWVTEYSIPLGPRKNGYPTNYKVDIAHPKLKIAVEVDGNNHKHPSNIAKDLKKTRKLQELGWRVLRVTNEEIMTNSFQALSKVKKFVKDS